MKISALYNVNLQTFKSRNKDVRKADDIKREVQHSFPMASPLYMRKTYSVYKKDSENNQKAVQIRKNIDCNITAIRNIANFPFLYGIMRPFSSYERVNKCLYTLIGMHKYKTGNCSESANATLATLAAKGYNNSNTASLYANTKFINKQTGKIDFEVIKPIDHMFVVSDLGQKNRVKDEDKIVIDSWMDFADSVSGAKARYKAFYADEIKDMETEALVDFKLKEIDNGRCVSRSDYDIKTNMVIENDDVLRDEVMKDLGYYTQITLDCFEE